MMTVFISHWFPTVYFAEKITVLKEGDHVDLGSFWQLMHRYGLYAVLFLLQDMGTAGGRISPSLTEIDLALGIP